MAFYEELLELERAVLAKMKELAANRPDELREAVVESNIEPLEALIQDFESRLRFWRSQASEGPAS